MSRRFVLAAVVLGCAFAAVRVGASSPAALPSPPFKVDFLPGWQAEHIAFAQGSSGRPVGGPARWAVGGVLPLAAYPAEHADRLYSPDSDVRVYFSDQRRRIWLLEKGEVWPIAGADDLGETDGPGPFASFIYTGVYGGHHDGMVASGYTVYVLDNSRLRRIQRQADGSWLVATVAGAGRRTLHPGDQASLEELGPLGKGLAIDAAGNIFFPLAGGIVRAAPEGRVSWLITADRVMADMADVYRRKWPDAPVPKFVLGSGEGVELTAHRNGDLYGGGRTFPPAWKVTRDGRFVPLVGYAPKDRLLRDRRWGEGDPALYEPHCPMGFSVTPEGYVTIQNEIPFAKSRYEENRVSVLTKDGTWGLLPADSKDFLRIPQGMEMRMDGVLEGNAPGPFHSRTAWIRLRRMP